MKEKGAVYLPHTAGRYAAKRFRKSQVSSRDVSRNEGEVPAFRVRSSGLSTFSVRSSGLSTCYL